MRKTLLAWFLVLAVVPAAFAGLQQSVQPTQPTQSPAAPADGISAFVTEIEHAITDSGRDPVRLLAPAARTTGDADSFLSLFQSGASKALVKERDRVCGPSTCRLIVDVFRQEGMSASVSTWRLDLGRAGESMGDTSPWSIGRVERLSVVTGLFRLSIDTQNVYNARGVTLEGEDFRLQMTEGSVYVLSASGHPTGYIFIGKGEFTFSPFPTAERGQMKIYAGTESLQDGVDGVFVRVCPADAADRVKGLTEKQSDLHDLKRAEEILRDVGWRTFTLDLNDLSSDTWSVVPLPGDFVVDMMTRRHGNLTFTVSSSEPEDITLFDRKARRNIAQYASRDRLAARGMFYADDDRKDYEVIDYDVDARFMPEQSRVEATAKLSVIVRAPSISTLTIRLADTLGLLGVSSPEYGRLLALRVRGRDSIVITFPGYITRGTRFTLTFAYAGTVQLQSSDSQRSRDTEDEQEETQTGPLELSYLFTHVPYWYPQPSVLGYATATLRATVPLKFGVRASGQMVEKQRDASDQALERAGFHRFVFRAARPLRYLSCVITPLVQVKSVHVGSSDKPSAPSELASAWPPADSVDIQVLANPREKSSGNDMAALSSDIVKFYGGIIGDYPYGTMSVVLIEASLPGGHTPAYMSIINQVRANSKLVWKDDPANIDGFPEYFAAHELAHMWWGQAVGWKNYHEQWLSEAFAQYFAALYAERIHGSDLFQDILKRWQRWTIDKSDQGPVYLGYRVGHIKGDARAFRAVVYNKGAIVLHMLRRIVGDDAFFRALRRFYRESRFHKAGTDDLQRAFEAETSLPLSRFFERWIYADTLPKVKISSQLSSAGGHDELIVTVQQLGEPFDVPITVTLDYGGKRPQEVTLRVADARQEFRLPLSGQLRRFDFNKTGFSPFAAFTVSPDAPTISASARRSGNK